MKRFWKRIQKTMNRLCIVDRFLILFMIVLLSYMIFHIFAGGSMISEGNNIDVIVRTAAAAIFGYFISSNFSAIILPDSTNRTDMPNRILDSAPFKQEQAHAFKNKIGFQGLEENFDSEADDANTLEMTASIPIECHKIQVIIVAGIGLISLAILLIARFVIEITPETAAILSQLKDFVSACIGFLISCRKGPQFA